jgi:hypothetical protein
MNLLTYTPPTQRVRVTVHPPSDAPVWKISRTEPKRLKKYESALRVQVEFPGQDNFGGAKSYTAYVVLDWADGDLDDAVSAAARDCATRYIDAVCDTPW